MMKTSCLILILFIFSGCSSTPYVVNSTAQPFATVGEYIYVVSHGWHTGFVIPAAAIQSQLPELRERFGDTPYLEFGWGDKGFYQAEAITTGITIKALFWPSDVVVHVVAVPVEAGKYFPESQVERLFIGAAEYSSLVRFVASSFYRNAEGKIEEFESGIYGESQFYQGVGNFNLFNTCNKWTAKGLKSAGFKISTASTLTADSVMKFLANYKQSLKSESNNQQ